MEPIVGIGLLTLDFPKILKPYIQQLGDYPSTNPELLTHYTFSIPLLTVLLTPLAAIPVLMTRLEPEVFRDSAEEADALSLDVHKYAHMKISRAATDCREPVRRPLGSDLRAL